jgi:hypothetical protein
MWLRVTSVVPALLLAGCDPFYGVESRATLPGPVDVRCVNAALASLPDVGRVTYQRRENRSTEILPKQRKVVTVMHVWLYGEGGGDILQINQTPDGWDYRNARSRMGVAVPHEEMARFKPVMLKVNGAIQLRCGLPVGNLKAEPVGDTKPQEL